MADYAKGRATTYKPGDDVEVSGVYRVIHDQQHTQEHEVTVVRGRKFPPCNHCGRHPRFKAVHLAQHIDSNVNFSR